MKISVAVILSLLMLPPAEADATRNAIIQNKEVDKCVESYGDNNDECLSDLRDRTEKNLYLVFNKKLQEIKQFDFSKWWMGSREQQKIMIDSFKKNQSQWIEYRNNYCQIASTGAESTHSYGLSLLSCIMNLNKLRIKQIEMIHPDLSDE